MHIFNGSVYIIGPWKLLLWTFIQSIWKGSLLTIILTYWWRIKIQIKEARQQTVTGTKVNPVPRHNLVSLCTCCFDINKMISGYRNISKWCQIVCIIAIHSCSDKMFVSRRFQATSICVKMITLPQAPGASVSHTKQDILTSLNAYLAVFIFQGIQ